MAIAISELENILLVKFPQAKIKIIDLVGDEDHYSLHIADQSFAGKSVVTQHRMVNEALSEVLKSRLHAITIKTTAN
jgi:stress-induced morphogen